MSTEIVDAEARAEIKLLNLKMDNFTDALTRHMEYEERQRDRLEEKLTAIWKRLNLLTYGAALGAGGLGGLQAILGMHGMG